MFKNPNLVKRNIKYGIAAFVFLAVVSMMAFQSHLVAAPEVGTGVGDKAPDFTLTNLNGAKVKLSDVVSKNKATLINFWAIWCPYCVREIPDLVKFYNQYHTQKVEILGVDVGDNPGDIRAFVRKNPMNYPILKDQKESVVNLYQVRGFPTTIILDRNRQIADVIVGVTNLDALSKRVETLLKEK